MSAPSTPTPPPHRSETPRDEQFEARDPLGHSSPSRPTVAKVSIEGSELKLKLDGWPKKTWLQEHIFETLIVKGIMVAVIGTALTFVGQCALDRHAASERRAEREEQDRQQVLKARQDAYRLFVNDFPRAFYYRFRAEYYKHIASETEKKDRAEIDSAMSKYEEFDKRYFDGPSCEAILVKIIFVFSTEAGGFKHDAEVVLALDRLRKSTDDLLNATSSLDANSAFRRGIDEFESSTSLVERRLVLDLGGRYYAGNGLFQQPAGK
jgi:hypothetical protein